MSLNSIENIWLRRLSILTFPVLIPTSIVWSCAVACWEEVFQYVPSAIFETVVLMWNPKRKYA